MRIKTKQLIDGEPDHIPFNRWFQIECCDCGLVHDVIIKKGKTGVWRTVKRNTPDKEPEQSITCSECGIEDGHKNGCSKYTPPWVTDDSGPDKELEGECPECGELGFHNPECIKVWKNSTGQSKGGE